MALAAAVGPLVLDEFKIKLVTQQHVEMASAIVCALPLLDKEHAPHPVPALAPIKTGRLMATKAAAEPRQ